MQIITYLSNTKSALERANNLESPYTYMYYLLLILITSCKVMLSYTKWLLINITFAVVQ